MDNSKDGSPVFAWQDNLISADYSLVDAAIEKANELDKELYSNYDVVTAAIEAVDRNKSKAEQAEVDAMAQAIEDAIAALEYRAADYTAVDAAIAKAEALTPENYTDFSAVETAVSAGDPRPGHHPIRPKWTPWPRPSRTPSPRWSTGRRTTPPWTPPSPKPKP